MALRLKGQGHSGAPRPHMYSMTTQPGRHGIGQRDVEAVIGEPITLSPRTESVAALEVLRGAGKQPYAHPAVAPDEDS